MVDDVADVDVTGHGTVLRDRGVDAPSSASAIRVRFRCPNVTVCMPARLCMLTSVANCAMNSHTISLEGLSPVPRKVRVVADGIEAHQPNLSIGGAIGVPADVVLRILGVNLRKGTAAPVQVVMRPCSRASFWKTSPSAYNTFAGHGGIGAVYVEGASVMR